MRFPAILVITLLCCVHLLYAQQQLPAQKIGASLKLLLSQPVPDPVFVTGAGDALRIAVLIEAVDAAACYALKKKG